MSSAQSTGEMFTNMLMATGVLIAAVVILVVVSLIVYQKTAKDRDSS